MTWSWTNRNWRLYLDPEFVQTLDTPQLAALLVHEVGHLLRDHAERSDRVGVTLSTAAWANMCQDAEINGETPRLPLPGRPVLPGHVGVDAGTPWEIPYLQADHRPETMAGGCGSGATGGEPRNYEEDTHPVVTIAQAERIRDDVAASILDQPGTPEGGWLRWAQERLPSR